ncbi:restriction endonuclease [Kosmotoga pacifica]|uniref:Restriction endonuclease type IV Mrr domain-containing protein n=1 Tax=Kosmotoga pacifica TaxID=1330330 RepID=A0A0G2Z899_9BACT|nr:restriction endonuclease [Kosmotoga pacifica]AKI97840.1 hypothetical protein IX53_08490 [Kosmotoga pacifica]
MLTDIDFASLSRYLLIYAVPPIVVALIALVYVFTRKRRAKMALKSMLLVDNLSGKDFERFLLFLFKRLGYKARLTRRGKDQGADLVIKKWIFWTAVQAKRYNGSVGNFAVQEVYASRKIYNCRKAMVVTNRTFTREARELAEKNKVTLWDREKLLKAMTKAGITPKMVGRIVTRRKD